MITVRTDTTKLKARLGAVLGTLVPLQEEAVELMGQEFKRTAAMISPRDTQRYVRGWMQAGNQAGIPPFALPTIKPSAYIAKSTKRLKRQADRWGKVVEREREVRDYWAQVYTNRYIRIGRNDKHGRQAQRKMEAADKRLEKALDIYQSAVEQLLNLDPTSILIGGKYGLKGGIGNDAARRLNERTNEQKLRKSSLDTVRTQIYGGVGRKMKIGNGRITVISLAQLEPHARIVEARHRVRARSLAAVKRTALPKANARLVAMLTRAWRG